MKKKEKYWSGRVTRESKALNLEQGVFSLPDPRRIALSLKRSAEASDRRRSAPFRSAMSMLNFYINRAGKNLPKSRLAILNRVKNELRRLFGRALLLTILATLLIGSVCLALINPSDIVKSNGLPRIGKWMFTTDLKPANWLGQKYQGKEMREPINVVVIDQQSTSSTEAIKCLARACRQAGYNDRWGHSGGYHGYIAGVFYPQLPSGKDRAFSNVPFIMSNNHGRFFGPYFDGKRYYLSASFSRELIVLTLDQKKMHKYGSFKIARDDFASRMNKKSDYKIAKYADLKNALINDPILTTGDHDGRAVVLLRE